MFDQALAHSTSTDASRLQVAYADLLLAVGVQIVALAIAIWKGGSWVASINAHLEQLNESIRLIRRNLERSQADVAALDRRVTALEATARVDVKRMGGSP